MELLELLDLARNKINYRQINEFVKAGSVAAAILTDSGSVYCGVNIEVTCSLGMCAERNACANMLTNGENRIVKLACVNMYGDIGMPCGACREMLMQLDADNVNMEIITDYDGGSVTLGELCPGWWGESEFGKHLRLIEERRLL